jgi:hypothetical protein
MRLAYRLEGGEDTENKLVVPNIRFNYKDDKDLKISVRITQRVKWNRTCIKKLLGLRSLVKISCTWTLEIDSPYKTYRRWDETLR